MSAPELVIEPRAYDDPDVVRMVAEVQAIYVQMYGGPDEATVVDDEFVPPNGVLFVGLLDGVAVAMGGWRRLPRAEPKEPTEQTAEIKRMYTGPLAQRRGVGRTMLRAVERSAAAAGITRLVLNTGPHQHAAIALYEAEQYAASEPFGHYADHGEALFMAKRLDRDAGHTPEQHETRPA